MDFERQLNVYLGVYPSRDDIWLPYQNIVEEVIRIKYKKLQQAS